MCTDFHLKYSEFHLHFEKCVLAFSQVKYREFHISYRKATCIYSYKNTEFCASCRKILPMCQYVTCKNSIFRNGILSIERDLEMLRIAFH